MTYLDPPRRIDEVRLEALKLAVEWADQGDFSTEDIVTSAARFETYLVEGT